MKVLPIGLKIVKSFLIVGDSSTLVLVDAGNPGDGEKIAGKVREMGYRPEDISIILLTHGHRDHIGGIKILKEITGAEILIHENEAKVLEKGIEPPIKPRGFLGNLMSLFISNRREDLSDLVEGVEPDFLVEEKLTLNALGIDGEVIHTPGHTSGSLSVVLNDGSAIVGDLVMGRLFVLGRASYPIIAADADELKRSIRKILAKNPNNIYPSHGGPFRPGDLERLA